jgi:hypothetical protein
MFLPNLQRTQMLSGSQESANTASDTIAPTMTYTSAEDRSRSHEAAKKIEATPVRTKYDVRTTNVTEDLEDRYDKQLDYMCDSVQEMHRKQVFISQKQRDLQQAQEQPDLAKRGPLSAEVDEMLKQVSKDSVAVEQMRKLLEGSRKVVTATKRTERQFTLEAQMMRNEKAIGEVSQRMEEDQARIDQRRQENEDLQQEIAWLTENEIMWKGDKPIGRLNELVETHEKLRLAAIEKSRSATNLFARAESDMFKIKEDDKELMRWEAAKLLGEAELLDWRLRTCGKEIAEVSGEAIKRREFEIQVHEREVQRRKIRMLECTCEIEGIDKTQRKISMVSLE